MFTYVIVYIHTYIYIYICPIPLAVLFKRLVHLIRLDSISGLPAPPVARFFTEGSGLPPARHAVLRD